MISDNSVVILSMGRTPIGAYNGVLASLSGPRLGAYAIRGALDKLKASLPNVDDHVQECIMGNVMSAGIGQGPARQACIYAGLKNSVCCTTVNKVCSSGMKALMMGAQQLETGVRDGIIVVGGFESMSRVPYYMPDLRFGKRMQHATAQDGMILDGLWDPYGDRHMGSCAELCAREESVDRNAQDEYATQSFRRAKSGMASIKRWEIVPTGGNENRKQKGAALLTEDEAVSKLDEKKLRTLKPAFWKPKQGDDYQGTVTAGNASGLGDGGACLVLSTYKFAKQHSLTPLAVLRGAGDFEHEPVRFPVAPEGAVKIAMQRANTAVKDVSVWEFNEAFAVVAVANARKLGISPTHPGLNGRGGAISLGHPLGMSGARVVMASIAGLMDLEMMHAANGQPEEKKKDKLIAVAGICNGGGGASAVVLEVPAEWKAHHSKVAAKL